MRKKIHFDLIDDFSIINFVMKQNSLCSVTPGEESVEKEKLYDLSPFISELNNRFEVWRRNGFYAKAVCNKINKELVIDKTADKFGRETS